MSLTARRTEAAPMVTPPDQVGSTSARRVQYVFFGVYLALAAAYLVLGRHWTDEGWYLNAARLVGA